MIEEMIQRALKVEAKPKRRAIAFSAYRLAILHGEGKLENKAWKVFSDAC